MRSAQKKSPCRNVSANLLSLFVADIASFTCRPAASSAFGGRIGISKPSPWGSAASLKRRGDDRHGRARNDHGKSRHGVVKAWRSSAAAAIAAVTAGGS